MINKRTAASAGVGIGGLAAAIALIIPTIQQWEGTRYHPYRDVAGVLTVCTGHTGSDIRPKDEYKPEECKELLESDVSKFATGVIRVTPSIEDKPYVLASAISFSYNVGLDNYKNGSVAKNFNKGEYALGCGYMLLYTKAGGKFYQGLRNRREDEFKICIKGVE